MSALRTMGLRGAQVLLAVCALAACSARGTAQLQLSIGFDDSIADAELAQVKTVVVHASGDEDASFPITLDRAFGRIERIVYRPAASTRSIGVSIGAYAADGSTVASGSIGPVPLAAGATLPLSITLAAVAPAADGGQTDATTRDLAGPDLGVQAPTFVNVVLTTAGNGSPILAAPPSGVMPGMLLLATFTATNTFDATSITLTAPSGWSVLTSVTDNNGSKSVTTWFWKIAGAEPTSYDFARTNNYSCALMIAAYSGVSQTGSPFDATLAMPNANTLTPMAPSVTTSRAGLLLVVNALCPTTFAQGWGTPTGFVARQTSGMLSADAPQKSQGDTGAVLLPTDASPCRFTTFTTSIKPD